MTKSIYKVLRFSGLPFLFKELVQRNKVTILLFHDINKNAAEKAFLYLAEHYKIIDLNEFIQSCIQRDTTKIPNKAMIITFDDGHISNYELLPILKKYDIPVTIFLCASIINTNRHFWFRVKNLTISLDELKRKTNKDRLLSLAKLGFEQEKEYQNPQALNKKQIDAMRRSVNFQSHTLFHPILPNCDDQEAQIEIVNSKIVLENQFNLRINSISYPNGDYSERDIELSKEAGYQCGITVDYGFNSIDSDLFRLKRLSVNDTDDINELIVKASGVWSFLKTRNGRKQKYGFKKNDKQ